MNDKVLLVVAHAFPSEDERFSQGAYIKSPLREVRKYFKKVIVISPVPFSFGLTRDDRFCRNYSFGNVDVYFPRVFHLPFSFFRERLGDVHLAAVKRVIEEENLRFDIIHGYNTWTGGYVAVRLKKDYDVPVVVSVLEHENRFYSQIHSWDFRYHGVWRGADMIFRNNKKDIPVLKRFNSLAEYLLVGFNAERFKILSRRKCREELGIPLGAKVFLNVANYTNEQKNQATLIRAAELLKSAELPDFIVYLVGFGKDEGLLRRMVSERGLQDIVRIVGPCTHKDLPLWMNAADVFVLPSYSEANPTVMFEVLACGIPFIGTNTGGVLEVIRNKGLGLIYSPPDDDVKLAGLMIKALDAVWNREDIRKYSLRFTCSEVARKTWKCYKRLMDCHEPIDVYNFKGVK